MISETEIVFRLLLGTVIGGIIGFERQIHGRPAGFRTQLLVCVACVLLMIVSEYNITLDGFDPAYVRADPGRIAAGAITGVGFLGAGVILKTGFTVQGLTTAACIWIVSAIGLAIGRGLYLASIVAFIITLITLMVLRIVERKMPKQTFRFVTVSAEADVDEDSLTSVIERSGAIVQNVDYEHCREGGETTFRFTVAFYRKTSLKRLLDALSALTFVRSVCIKS
ncbi:MAG: MgtC/SapB family protein [Nitrospirota bacterium]